MVEELNQVGSEPHQLTATLDLDAKSAFLAAITDHRADTRRGRDGLPKYLTHLAGKLVRPSLSGVSDLDLVPEGCHSHPIIVGRSGRHLRIATGAACSFFKMTWGFRSP